MESKTVGEKTIVIIASVLAILILAGAAYGVVEKQYEVDFSSATAIPEWMMVNNGHIAYSEADQSNALLVRTPYNEDVPEQGGLETRNGTFVGLPTTGDTVEPLMRYWAWWNFSITTNPHQIDNGGEPAYNVSVWIVLYDHRYALAHNDPDERVLAYDKNYTVLYVGYDKDAKEVSAYVYGENTTGAYSQTLFEGRAMNTDTMKIDVQIKYEGLDSNNMVTVNVAVTDTTNTLNKVYGSGTYHSDVTFDLNNAMVSTIVVYSSGDRLTYEEYEGEFSVTEYQFTYGDFTSGGSGGGGSGGTGGGTGDNSTGDNNETNPDTESPISLIGEKWVLVALVVAIVVAVATVSYMVFYRKNP